MKHHKHGFHQIPWGTFSFCRPPWGNGTFAEGPLHTYLGPSPFSVLYPILFLTPSLVLPSSLFSFAYLELCLPSIPFSCTVLLSLSFLWFLPLTLISPRPLAFNPINPCILPLPLYPASVTLIQRADSIVPQSHCKAITT